MRKHTFNLETETGQRGAKPESNKILDSEQELLHLKKDKTLEIFRNCTEVRELVMSQEHNPKNLKSNEIFDMLY